MLAERKVTKTANYIEESFPFKGNTRSVGVYVSRFNELEISLVC
jgi:hypothetical protein